MRRGKTRRPNAVWAEFYSFDREDSLNSWLQWARQNKAVLLVPNDRYTGVLVYPASLVAAGAALTAAARAGRRRLHAAHDMKKYGLESFGARFATTSRASAASVTRSVEEGANA